MRHFVNVACESLHLGDIAVQVDIVGRASEVSMNFRMHVRRFALQADGESVNVSMALSLGAVRAAEDCRSEYHCEQTSFQ